VGRSGITWAQRRRNLVKEGKAGGCVTCGSSRQLVYHHIDPRTKKFDIGLGSRSWAVASLSELEAEIRKCAVLCMSCHAVVHRGAPPKRKDVDRDLIVLLQEAARLK
jgi:hypothetical protein